MKFSQKFRRSCEEKVMDRWTAAIQHNTLIFLNADI
jgi:hypothetical protein